MQLLLQRSKTFMQKIVADPVHAASFYKRRVLLLIFFISLAKINYCIYC